MAWFKKQIKDSGDSKTKYHSIEELTQASEKGDAQAQYLLGMCYEFGWGVDVDKNMAEELYRHSAEQGLAAGQFCLANILCTALEYETEVVTRYITTRKRSVEALSWYKKAAEQGDVESIYQIGIFYQKGLGVDKDFSEASKWFSKAADLGFPAAQYALALQYGDGKGVNRDLRKAFKLYKKAAKQGYSRAQCNLGYCYLNGEGTIPDANKGIEWLMKSAEQEYKYAEFKLGECYSLGHGVVENHIEAAKWYAKAAEHGHPDALSRVGYCHEKGDGVDKDEEKAFEFYNRAASLDSLEGIHNLGSCYYFGIGTEKNLESAIHCWALSSERGHPISQRNLGLMLIKGDELELDMAKGVELLLRASLNGDDKAKQLLIKLADSSITDPRSGKTINAIIHEHSLLEAKKLT